MSSERGASKSCNVGLVRKTCLGEEKQSPSAGMGARWEAEGR